MNKKINIQCLSISKEFLPIYSTDGASGADLFAAVEEEVIIKQGERKLISSGIKLEIPDGYEAQIRPRSGLAIKYGITLVNTPGTIDSDYRGEIKIIMINLGKEDFTIKRGDRIAQMVIAPVIKADFIFGTSLNETKRGSGGFGSTGI